MEVRLSNGYTTIVDEDDWFGKNLFLLPWYGVRKRGGRIYVVAKVPDPVTGKQRTLRLHWVVMDAPPGMDVDHREGPGLDNRRANLRLCTNAQNQQNTGSRGGSSRFKGVSWVKSKGRWRVSFNWEGVTHFVGYFTDEVAAAKAYNEAAEHLCGGFARLNDISHVASRR
jgi:hypothetical protein